MNIAVRLLCVLEGGGLGIALGLSEPGPAFSGVAALQGTGIPRGSPELRSSDSELLDGATFVTVSMFL